MRFPKPRSEIKIQHRYSETADADDQRRSQKAKKMRRFARLVANTPGIMPTPNKDLWAPRAGHPKAQRKAKDRILAQMNRGQR